MDEPAPTYRRLLAASLHEALRDTPAVCLLGPRQCGKTTLARTLEPDYAYLSLDDEATLAFAHSDPTGFVLALPDKVVLDEVQRAPELLRAIKVSVDNKGHVAGRSQGKRMLEKWRPARIARRSISTADSSQPFSSR